MLSGIATNAGVAQPASMSHKGTDLGGPAGPSGAASVVFRRMLPQSRSYEELYRQFRWQVPAQFNIGVEVCDRWAERDPGKLAIVAVSQDGRSQDVSYGWLRETSNRLANALSAHGIKRGDRVAILLPQAPEVAAIHIAIYKLGAHRAAAGDAVRPRRDRLSAAEFRRQGAPHQRAGARQDRRDQATTATRSPASN